MSNNNQTADYDHFIEVCKRASKSGFKNLLFYNRMVIGCYDIAQDSDIGMHYILHIPDEYDALYDQQFVMNIPEFLKKLNEVRNKVKEERLKLNLPPRAVDGEVQYRVKEQTIEIEVGLRIHEMVPPPPETKRKTLVKGDVVMNLGFTTECNLVNSDGAAYQTDLTLDTIKKITERIGESEDDHVVLIDALENGLVDVVLGYPRVLYCDVKFGKDTVHVPLMKSFFHGVTKFDRLILTVMKTKIPGIYVYVITIDAKGLTHQSISYLQNFK